MNPVRPGHVSLYCTRSLLSPGASAIEVASSSMTLSSESNTAGGDRAVDEPRLLHHFFERVARQSPDLVALDIPPGAGHLERRLITYSELDSKSNSLASLLGTVVAGECVVAILLPRTTEHLFISQL